MNNALKMGSERYHSPSRLDIVKCYYRLMELRPSDFFQYQPKDMLEAMVINSMKLAIEEPDSGEAHRIWNRLIGKPRETQVNVNASLDLTQSGMYKALEEIRGKFGPKEIIEVDEEKVALEGPSRWDVTEKLKKKLPKKMAERRAPSLFGGSDGTNPGGDRRETGDATQDQGDATPAEVSVVRE